MISNTFMGICTERNDTERNDTEGKGTEGKGRVEIATMIDEDSRIPNEKIHDDKVGIKDTKDVVNNALDDFVTRVKKYFANMRKIPGQLLLVPFVWWKVIFLEDVKGLNGRADAAIRWGAAIGCVIMGITVLAWMAYDFKWLIMWRGFVVSHILGVCSAVALAAFFTKNGESTIL